MSQLDLLQELRDARPAAPAEVRERVRLLAAQAPPQRRVTWRRAAIVLVPALAVVGAAAIVLPRGERNTQSGPATSTVSLQPLPAQRGFARPGVPYSA